MTKQDWKLLKEIRKVKKLSEEDLTIILFLS